MAMDPGPIEPVPQPPEHRNFSRYRTLRGKSVSSAKGFEVFRDDGFQRGRSDSVGVKSQFSDEASNGSTFSLPRSKSASSFRNALRLRDNVPAVPPLPKDPKALTPKPINTSLASNFKVFEGLKSPIFSSEKLASWKQPSSAGPKLTASRTVQSITRSFSNKSLGAKSGSKAASKNKRKEEPESAKAKETADTSALPVTGELPNSDPPALEPSSEPEKESDPEPEPEIDPAPVLEQLLVPTPVPRPSTADPLLISKPVHLLETTPRADRRLPRLGPADLLADEVARLEAETDRILAEQKKRDLQRLQTQFLTPPPKSRRQFLDKLSFFSRGKRATSGNSVPQTPSSIVSSVFSPANSQSSRDTSLEESPYQKTVLEMSFIEQGGRGVVPQKDAPMTAVNANKERRITVRYLSSTFNLPVTTETCPMDILKASAAMTRHSLNPNFSVLVECYYVLGLERRLRKYERIRDVMNSWDRDQQNSLLILPCVNSVGDEDLELSNVPRTEEPPSGFCMQLYHSSRPGKWNKRWVTLLDNGQMFAAKAEEAKPSDKESLVMCHLTDFDIYAPKESEMKKTLKPPKRFCFAIKSQQRTVVFANGENFVHFFSTDDTTLATRFYDGVHAWRSWYLVNRMVDLERRNKVPQIDVEVSPNKSTQSSRTSNTSGAEQPSTPASTEDDEPLMNVSQFRMSNVVIQDPTSAALRRSSTIKTVTAASRVNALRQVPAPKEAEKQEFAATGLLGDDYDKRKQAEAAQSSPVETHKEDGPFVSAPTLLNGGVTQQGSRPATAVRHEPEMEAKSWFPSATEHTARERSKSVSQPQQRRPAAAISTAVSGRGAPTARDRGPGPLLNFAEDFPQPPRFRDAQRGLGVSRPPPGQPLINYAAGGTTQQPRNAAPPKSAPPRRGMPLSSSSRGRIVTGSGTGAPRSALPPPPPMPAGASRSRGLPPPAGQRMPHAGDGSPARRPRTSGI